MNRMSRLDEQWQTIMASHANSRMSYTQIGPREFRILVLYPGEPTDAIIGHIVRQDLDHIVQDYTALSYTWGDVNKTAAIRCIIDDRIPLKSGASRSEDYDAGELQVTENLLGALQRFRRRDEMTALWVDAICIDQGNVEERNQQVQIMGEIYGRALKTAMWLGEAADDSDEGFKLIEELFAARRPDGISVVGKPTHELESRVMSPCMT